MNFDPPKFFIGLIDFFSILMPGALVVYLGSAYLDYGCAKSVFPTAVALDLKSAEGVIVGFLLNGNIWTFWVVDASGDVCLRQLTV